MCLRAPLCWQETSGRTLESATAPLCCGKALKGCLPGSVLLVTSQSSLNTRHADALHHLIYWKHLLQKKPTQPLWVHHITCYSGQKQWDRKQFFVCPYAPQPVHLKWNQPWVLIGRTDAEAEALILWPPDGKSWLVGKDPDAGKDWRREEEKVAEDEMVR